MASSSGGGGKVVVDGISQLKFACSRRQLAWPSQIDTEAGNKQALAGASLDSVAVAASAIVRPR